MPNEGGDPGRRARALRAALDEALVGFPDEDRAAALDAADDRLLGIGMRLGLERQGQARYMLGLMDDQGDRAAPREAEAGDPSLFGVPLAVGPAGSVPVPVASSLLARAAALPQSDRAAVGPEVAYGWAARLAPHEILSLGRVILDMLAAGSPPDVGRGFGLAWDAGVRLPRHEVNAMFREFAELEVTVGGVLAGRDLRAIDEPASRSGGLASVFDSWMTRKGQGQSPAGAALNSSGEPGRRGLVALWNVWVAMRYRTLIPPPTFELLVHPWVTVVGPLPPP